MCAVVEGTNAGAVAPPGGVCRVVPLIAWRQSSMEPCRCDSKAIGNDLNAANLVTLKLLVLYYLLCL